MTLVAGTDLDANDDNVVSTVGDPGAKIVGGRVFAHVPGANKDAKMFDVG